ncbi:MAG: D-alanyl-D-alanine carboxypeptidase [Chloroflexi bacterium]|nr:D-alanyl-D-alanine carboxypeptidase [Chloroflexota bacterium]
MTGRVARLALVGLLFCVTAGFRPAGLTDGGTVPVVLPPARQADLVEPSPPTVDARAALLLDADSRQVLFTHDAGVPLPPASTTKLMTALLVAESGRYFDPVTVEAADLVGGSSMGLAAGETLNVRDLLDGLLLASGNDAAYALARHLGARLPGTSRPVARFVARMNVRAGELGLRDTRFRNPEGLDEAGHVMSAADLATLALAALRQPVIAQIVATPATTVRSSRRSYALRSTNQLFGRLPGVLGVKTGTTDAAGECLVALVERDGHRLLVVVLGSSDRYTDTTALIEWGFDTHRWLTPPAALADAAAPPGWVAALVPAPAIVVPAAQVQFIDYRLRLNRPGQTPGGALDVMMFERRIASRPLAMAPLGQTIRPAPGW